MTNFHSEHNYFERKNHFYETGIVFFIVVLLTLFCFLPDLRNDLLDWDDAGYILENTHIRSFSVEMIRWAFSEFYLNYWAPLTWISLAFDYTLWGENPVGYHLTNNLLHSLNAGFFVLICLELLKTGQPAFPQHDKKSRFTIHPYIFCSGLAAILFAIHPLRVESVAWATERKDVLSLFFGLPAVLFYLWHTEATGTAPAHSNRSTWAASINYWLSFAFFSFSLLSKSLMITLPVMLLVLDWFPLKRLKSAGSIAIIAEKVPFLILSVSVSLFTMQAHTATTFSLDQINLYTRLLNAIKSVLAYLQLTFWPLNLSPFYVHPKNIPYITTEYAKLIVIFILITIGCIITVRRIPIFMAVWLIFLVALLPFLGFTQSGAQAMAGRFTYFAGLPLALLSSFGITYTFERLSGSRAASVSIGAVVALLLIINGYLTVREISFWKDDVTLWTRVIDLAPNASGRAYFQRGNAYRIKRDYQRALVDTNIAIAIAESKKYNAMHDLYQMRGGIFLESGNVSGAIQDYTKALDSATGGARSMVYYMRGIAYQKSGRLDLATEDFRLSGTKELTK